MDIAHIHVKKHKRRHHHSVLFLLIPALIFALLVTLLAKALPGDRVRGAATSIENPKH
ncbi:MAG: hypothetical protein AAB599_01295 [Patescibacteria group bacterium]